VELQLARGKRQGVEIKPGDNMKFLVTYRYPADKFVPVVKAWGSLTPQERANVGDGAKKIGHWHDVVGRKALPLLNRTI